MAYTETHLLDPNHLNEIFNYRPKNTALHPRLADYLEVLQQINPAQTIESMVREDLHTQPRDFTEIAWGLYLNLTVAQAFAEHSEFSVPEKLKLKAHQSTLTIT
jgi:hypothetical protein